MRKIGITSSGIANQSGLEVFSSITNYTGEYVNWGNALSYRTQLTSDPDYAVSDTAADPHIDALVNAPQTASGQWMRYHTATGDNYVAATAPTSLSGFYNFSGVKSEGLTSYSGMYQRMSLVSGDEYQIGILTSIDSGDGSLYVNIYYPSGDTYILNTTSNISYPVSRTSTSLINSTFTARTPYDVIVLYFTTSRSSSQTASICNITIEDKKDFLTPIYMGDKHDNAHKVLRRNIGRLPLNS